MHTKVVISLNDNEQLTDTCVKNAGDAFVREIASREFMETLTMILHSVSGDYDLRNYIVLITHNTSQSDCNLDVKNKILAVIQTWAIAAKNNPSLSYLTDTYHLLQHERFQFPPLNEPVNALLLETAAVCLNPIITLLCLLISISFSHLNGPILMYVNVAGHHLHSPIAK